MNEFVIFACWARAEGGAGILQSEAGDRNRLATDSPGDLGEIPFPLWVSVSLARKCGG